jgi:hypothetical protein
MQDRKLAFLNGPIDKRTVSSQRLEARLEIYRAGRFGHTGRSPLGHPL